MTKRTTGELAPPADSKRDSPVWTPRKPSPAPQESAKSKKSTARRGALIECFIDHCFFLQKSQAQFCLGAVWFIWFCDALCKLYASLFRSLIMPLVAGDASQS